MSKKYSLIVYVGRFQPFHIAHLQVLETAISLAENVLVVVGSHNTALNVKNPFSFDERVQFIKLSTHSLSLGVAGIPDYAYDDQMWVEHLGQLVDDYQLPRPSYGPIGIIGHNKDESSYYLDYFPQWELISVDKIPLNGGTIDATKIRNLMFEQEYSFIKGVLPDPVYNYIVERFADTERYQILKQEYDYVCEYRRAWANSPYPPTFVTVDAVVVQSGHILLVERKVQPGAGLWALPGGFINQDETIQSAMVRELREETRLRVPEKVLHGSIVKQQVFDNPTRSLRGRTVTHAFTVKLDDHQPLPEVRGSDDAKSAKWISLAEFAKMQPKMFEDHFGIANKMLSF